MDIYKVLQSSQTVYIDGGQPVSGYAVRVLLTQFNEQYTINVPTLDADRIDQAVQELWAARTSLMTLGSIPDSG